MPNKLVLIILLTLSVAGSAKTYRVPEDDAIAQVSIPDQWKTEQREEHLDSALPNQAGHLLIMPVEGRKLGDSMLEAMRYIRRNGTVRVDARTEKRETIKLGERTLHRFSWTATEKDRPITIRCNVISELNDKRLLVVFWGPAAGESKHQHQIERILKSVRAF